MISYKILSEVGDRKLNEDSAGRAQRDDLYCFVLADGLGGHGNGDLASQAAVKTVVEYFEKQGTLSEECVIECFNRAQSQVMAKQRELNKPQEMKTTMVILVTDGQKAIWGHVGDSRLYRIHKNKEIIHTLDHSVPQMLVALGEITDKDIRHHADRNRLLRVLGVEWDKPKCEISPQIGVEPKDAFLLCSDGFWELIEDKEMVALLKKTKDVQDWVAKMQEIVLENGQGTNMDNYSVVAVRITKD